MLSGTVKFFDSGRRNYGILKYCTPEGEQREIPFYGDGRKAIVLISTGDISELADTTVLLLLSVFAVVNVTVLVLRRDRVEGEHFRAPAIAPVLGAIVSVLLIVDTLSDDVAVGARALALLALGLVLWVLNRIVLGRRERTG